MCGIFGEVTRYVSDGRIKKLWMACANRGERGVGLGSIDQAGRWGIVKGQTFEWFEQQHLWNAVVGHCLAPTNGEGPALAADRMHPFVDAEYGPLMFAHNGILLDWQKLERHPRMAHDLDSTRLLYTIEQQVKEPYSSLNGMWTLPIRTAMEKVEGQAACWLLDVPRQDLYLWRVMSPIYYSLKAGNHFTFSSVPDPGLRSDWVELKQGVVMKVHIPDISARFTGAFKYADPYGV